MANAQNFRFGQMHLTKMPVASATVIETGDLVYVADTANTVEPASMHNWAANLATVQAVFANLFLGIAYEQSRSGDTDDISIDVSPDSVYEFTVASAAYDLGDSLGPAQQSGGVLALQDQTLAAAVNTSSVARTCRQYSSAVTKAYVQFASAYNLAGNNVNAVVG